MIEKEYIESETYVPEDEEVELAEPAAAAAEQPLGPHDVETAAGELGT